MKVGGITGTFGVGAGSSTEDVGLEIRHAQEKVVGEMAFLSPDERPFVIRAGDNDESPRKRRGRFGTLRLRLFTFQRRTGAHPALTDSRYRRVFPLRDRENQLHVHPDLADPCDRMKVDPALKLLDVAIGEEYAAVLRHDIAAGLFPDKQAGVRGLTRAEQDAVAVRFRMLISDLRSALDRMMKAEEPVPPEDVYVRTLTKADLMPGEGALEGQYGLFNRKDAAGKWRSVTEGRFLCFFSGFFCRNETEYEAECARYPREEIDAYALVIGNGDYPCISPFQGGDLGQFANSAIRKDAGGRMVEDKSRTNTRFARADLVFRDNRPGGHGARILYPVVFLYMLGDSGQDGQFEREARVWYGQQYWDSFSA